MFTMQLKYIDLIRRLITRTHRLNISESDHQSDDVPVWKRKRYLVFLLLTLGFVNVAFMRNCLGVVIVEMAAVKEILLVNGTTVKEQDFDWDTKKQGLILSTFAYGYLTSQLFGGLICRKFGAVSVFSIGVGTAGILSIVAPLVAYQGYEWFIILRISQGLMMGTLFPVLLCFVTRWTPIHERSRMISFAVFGNYVGCVLNFPITGALIVAVGWKCVFYVFGVSGFIWALVCAIVIKDGADVDPLISEKEKTYILQRLETASTDKTYKVPWKGILTSSGVWAITVVNFAQNWGSSTFHTQLPRFLIDTMDLNIDEAGYLSAFPFIFTCMSLLVSGILVDMVIQKGILSVYQTRRYFIVFAFFLDSVFVIVASHMTDKISFIIVLTLGVIWEPLAISSYSVNVVDLCPVSAPIILSIVTTLSMVSGIITPIVVGYVTQEQTVQEWQLIFYIIATFYLISASIYWFLSKAEIQPWSPAKKQPNNNDTLAH